MTEEQFRVKKQLVVEDPWYITRYKLDRNFINGFAIEGIEGSFNFATYEFMYLKIPEDKDPCGYYISYHSDGKPTIDISVNFSPIMGKIEINDYTKPKGRQRADYEELKTKALAVILSLSTKLKKTEGKDG